VTDFSDRVVLVTGAGSGIGRSHALFFAERGAKVIIHDRDTQKLLDVGHLISNAGNTIETINADVIDPNSFSSALIGCASIGKVDILINNVGVPSDEPIEDITADRFESVFRTNVLSTIIATQAVLPGMKTRRVGKIVITSSNWGLTGQQNSSLYSASKAALLGLTKSWAREFAPWKIYVNCVAPGGITTELLQTSEARLAGIPLGRHGDPIDISRVVGFLASEASDYMTGCVLNVTGGELIVGS
jgi:3-oxoacyl-[acyl-carrier protein] reductase